MSSNSTDLESPVTQSVEKLDDNLSELEQKKKQDEEKLKLLIENWSEKEKPNKPILLEKAVEASHKPKKITANRRGSRLSAPTTMVSPASQSTQQNYRPAPLFVKAKNEALRYHSQFH